MRASVLLLAAATVAVASAESVELFGTGDEGGEHYDFLASSLGSVSGILFLTTGPSNQRQ
jgi:predicted porin